MQRIIDRLQQHQVLIAFTILFLFIVIFQDHKVGFEKGHQGWVTSQHLSIIKRADCKNYFVGHTGDYVNRKGKRVYYYFNRAPFLFEALCNMVLTPFENDLVAYTYWGKQIFNIIFFLTIIFCFKFMYLLLDNRLQALGASLLTCSGYYFVFYKNLVEQNRLGTLAMIILFYAIAHYYKHNSSKRLIAVAAATAFMGEAAPGTFVLSIMMLIVAVRNFRRFSFLQAVKETVTRPPMKAWAVSFVIVLLLVGYNGLIESKIRNIPIGKTEIGKSARTRLGLEKGFQQKYAKELTWKVYAAKQTPRTLAGFFPYFFARIKFFGSLAKNGKYKQYIIPIVLLAMAILSFIIFVIIRLYRNVHDDFKQPVLIALTGGFFFIIVMKNLVRFHDFTTTYLIGIYILFFGGLMALFEKKGTVVALAVAVLIFGTSIISNRNYHNEVGGKVNVQADDFSRIKKKLGETPVRVYIKIPKGKILFYDGVPHAPDYFLEPHVIARTEKYAEYVIAHRGDYEGESLTRENREAFLFKKK